MGDRRVRNLRQRLDDLEDDATGFEITIVHHSHEAGTFDESEESLEFEEIDSSNDGRVTIRRAEDPDDTDRDPDGGGD